MTVLIVDGFESYGDDTTVGSAVETNISATNEIDFVTISGGHAGGNVSLIDDFEAVGFALEFPDTQAARSEYVRYSWPDGTGRFADYQVSTNASSPVFCVGFRLFNPTIVPSSTITGTIFSGLNSATGTAYTVRVDSNGTDLTLVDNDGISYTAASVLSLDTWHYIEVEWKQTTIANGGYCKIFVDGNEVINETSIDLAGFTFFSTYGFRIGIGTSGVNQTGGTNWAIDDVYGMVIDGVEHTAPLGACRVYAMRPASDDSVTWTPSTGGSNFALIDETDLDQSDYVESGVGGDIDKYGLTPLDNTSAVHALRVDVSCTAIGSGTAFAIGLDDGTLDEESKGTVATGSTQNFQQVFEADPSGDPWTESTAEAVKGTQKEV